MTRGRGPHWEATTPERPGAEQPTLPSTPLPHTLCCAARRQSARLNCAAPSCPRWPGTCPLHIPTLTTVRLRSSMPEHLVTLETPPGTLAGLREKPHEHRTPGMCPSGSPQGLLVTRFHVFKFSTTKETSQRYFLINH